MARVKWNTTSIRYIDSMWSNTEDWQEIRKSPELVTMFGGMGQSWVERLNTELHDAQARRRQPVEDGYKFAISHDQDRIRMRIWAYTARAMAHEARHQSILRLMHASGYDVNDKGRAQWDWGTRSGGHGGRKRGGGRGGSSGTGGSSSRSTGAGTRPSGRTGKSRRSMDPKKEARLRRQLITLDALAKDSAAGEGERALAAERARRFREQLGD